MEEANRLAKGLKESHLGLEEEIEACKQKCEGFSEVVNDLRNDVEGMINSPLSSFFDKVEEGKDKEGRDKNEKKEEGGERKEGKGNEMERRESKGKEGEDEERKGGEGE